MPYSPITGFDTPTNGQAFAQLGKGVGAMIKKFSDDAKEANALRGVMAAYDPDGADRYKAMGLDQLRIEHQVQTVKRAEEARKLDLAYKQAQIEASARSGAWTQAQIGNMAEDNARADQALKLSKQQASDAKWSGIRRDAQTWWDRTMQAKRLSDKDAELAKPPTVVDLNGNPYAFQSGTGHMQPLLNRNELTAQQRARSASDLTGRISQLSKQLDSLNPREPDYKALHQVLRDNLSLTQRARDQLLDLSQSDPFAMVNKRNGPVTPATTASDETRPTDHESGIQFGAAKTSAAKKKLTKQLAVDFLRRAGYDRKLAEQYANQAGFEF